VCNTKIWVDHGYRPQDLYDYYAEVEHQILASFFGRKSLGYQVLQDGFPRADALSGGFLGERLYGERLMNSSFLVNPSPPLPSTIVSVNEGYEARAVCNVPSINASGQPAVYENPGAPGPPVYCSTDTTNPPLTPRHLLLSIEPLRPSSMDPTRAYNGPTDEFPKAFEQSVTVLDEAGNGRFHDLTSITQINRVVGKLFVPQHSGLQPLSQERAALNYAPVASVKCRQQVGTRNLIIAPYYPEVGQYMADFPILESQAVSTDRAGCPNHWIVNQGKDQDSNPLFKFPPQLTGFQTTNKVRSIPHVESTLFNLTYNTNAVFIELYEDAIWRIAITKGTGPSALALAGPGSSIRTPGNPNNVCDPTLCYSKNLSQWAAELHVRRIEAAALWSKLQGISYPALEAPFPSTYQFTFQNTGVTAQVYSYINAGRCDPAAVDSGPLLNGKPSAMGVIKVLP
jgi:hypothetical protein